MNIDPKVQKATSAVKGFQKDGEQVVSQLGSDLKKVGAAAIRKAEQIVQKADQAAADASLKNL